MIDRAEQRRSLDDLLFDLHGMDGDIVQQHAARRRTGAETDSHRRLRMIRQQQRKMREHLGVRDQDRVGARDVLAVDEDASVLVVAQHADGARQAFRVVDDVQAVHLVVEGLVVGEDQQVGQHADHQQRGPVRAGDIARPQQQREGDQQAEVDQDQRRVPHADERDQHEPRQQAAQDAPGGV